MEIDGRESSTFGMIVDCGVSGGTSYVFARVLYAVGESASPTTLSLVRLFNEVRTGVSVVWRESFGLFEVGGRVGGMTESIVSATCFRSSEIPGNSGQFSLEGDSAVA